MLGVHKLRTLSAEIRLGGPDESGAAALPSEFQIFKRGPNATSKGTFLFDDIAAQSVMSAYERADVDLMLDLEHESLDASPTRADSRDARGWFKLELRDGALWGVGVNWTPDGARRLRERTQRYLSPAFDVDEHNRIVEILNVAICAMPATYGAQPLAASRSYPSDKFAVRARAASYLNKVKNGSR